MQSLGTRRWIRSLFQSWFSQPRQQAKKERTHCRPQVERLEDRVVPTTWTVTNLLGSGNGSLFHAVQSANSDTSPAIITFDPSVFATPQTITLATSLVFSNASEPISIQGPAGVAVTISGNRQGGAQIQDFIVSTGTVTIQNLTIADGNAGSNNGGGLLVSAGNVTVDHCTITNNIAGNGGGINLGGGNLLLENSVITGNTTNNTSYGNGGGYNISAGTSTIIGCLFTQNVSNNSIGGHGGAIDEQDAIMTVIDSTFIGNTAAAGAQQYGGNGGAICSSSSPDIIGTNFIIGCTFTGNIAGNGTGGGLEFYYYYNVTMLNDLIWNNTALTGPDLAGGSAGTIINYTLIGNPTGAYIPPGSVGNIYGVSTSPAILNSPANNGGATQNRMPTANSPELNAGGSVTTANAAVSSASAATLNVASGFVFAAASITPSLTFVNQPANTTAGATMSPVTVQVNKPVDFEEFIQIDSEIMEIVGLTINANGTATLNVERGMNGTTATTHAANAPIYLVSDQRGYVVSQPMAHVDIGAVQSAGTIPTAGLGMALKMGISSGTLNGTTTALTNASGQATFNNLSAPSPGTFQLVAAGITNSTSFTVNAGTYPTVTAVNPSSGSSSGTMTITGTNFTGATAVSFGGTPATSFTVNSSTSITATIPAGTGFVDVTVTNATGTSGVSASDRFSYAPSVTSVSPNVGNAGGGTVVTISGANFVGVTAVLFGTNNAASFTVNSPTSITATAPAGGNVVDITVVSAGGTSVIAAGDHFSYTSGTATYIVTNTLATGPGSLFAAVQSANATTLTSSLVTFDPTVFATPQTITLTNSLDLSNTSQIVTIQGPSGVAVTVSGNRQGGALLQDFVITAGTATIQNLTVADANAGSNDGGGFKIVGGTVTIDHCTITNNIAADGGGMVLTGGSVLLENSVITANTTNMLGYGSGGGIATTGGTLTILGCLFTQNACYSNIGGNGGAINEQNAIMTVIDSTFIGNLAAAGTQQYGGSGGAIDSAASPQNIGTNYIIGCTFTGNTAQNGGGGGISTGYYCNLTLLNDLIWNNTASAGPDLGDGSYYAPSINYTLIGNTNGTTIPAGSVGNILNVAPTPAILGALANNGGPTQSAMPVANSLPVGSAGKITTANSAVTSSTAATLSVASGYVFAASSLTPQLAFITQPTNTTAGAPMSPVAVQISRPVDFEEFIQVDNEIMEIVGLTINADGTATLNVERGADGTTAATHAANAPVYLVSDQRGEVVANQGTPPPVDIGAVQSSATTPTAGLGLALTMTLSSGTLNGVTTVLTNASGQATFNSLSVPTPGTYQLKLAGIATSNSFTVSAGTYPIVTGISPALGIAGTSITITGTNFTGATGVSFGGAAAASFTVNSNTSITATVPAGTGNVDVTVTTSVGTSAIAVADRFTYLPSVTGVNPVIGNVGGGSSVVITGANLTGATAVRFGAANAVGFTINSSTQITAIAPAGTGVVDITVVTPSGTSPTSSADHFSYVAAPTVAALSPSAGPAAGGTSVIITGSGFTGATAVSFGGVAATSFTVNSSTQITAIAPAGTGSVDVTVTTPSGGVSATSPADQFTYLLAPAVSSVAINGGAPAYTVNTGQPVSLAGQNSVVEQILVTFNEPVTLDPGAFTITNDYALVTVFGGAETPSTADVALNAPIPVAGSGGTQFILTFQAGPGTTPILGGTGNILNDGVYTLNTNGSMVHANGQTATDNHTGFWALYGSVAADNIFSPNFGDGNSEIFVDTPDAAAFKKTLGSQSNTSNRGFFVAGASTPTPYNVAMDSNLDGNVDALDTLRFRGNFGVDWVF